MERVLESVLASEPCWCEGTLRDCALVCGERVVLVARECTDDVRPVERRVVVCGFECGVR